MSDDWANRDELIDDIREAAKEIHEEEPYRGEMVLLLPPDLSLGQVIA